MTRNALVQQFRKTLNPIFSLNTSYEHFFDSLIIPDKIHQWKVTWKDDAGNFKTNTAYRVQHNNLLGPYKGGLRFHKDATSDVFESLAIEQTFKNSLTGRPLGGAKGGSNFDTTLHSERELRSFCRSFMIGLRDIIGTDLDVPAGDIGVNEKTIGILYGELVRQRNNKHDRGAFTGKPDGCEFRNMSTGYGVSYIANYHRPIEGKHIFHSGNGNVGYHAGQSAINYGGIVHTISSVKGTCYSESGLTHETFDMANDFLNDKITLLPPDVTFFEGIKPWEIDIDLKHSIDIAMPCSLQHEINHKNIDWMTKYGLQTVVEGANLACTPDANVQINMSNIEHLSGKLANIGGVVCSHEEMKGNQGYQLAEKNVYESIRYAYDQSVLTQETYNLDTIMCGATAFAFLRLFNRAEKL